MSEYFSRGRSRLFFFFFNFFFWIKLRLWVCLPTFMVLSFLGIELSAQSINLNLQNIGVKDGLPHREVHDIIQDHQGFIWVGTKNGLGRYDGRGFRNFSLREGLETNHVDYILEDDLHRFWLFSISESGNRLVNLQLFDPESFQFFGLPEALGEELPVRSEDVILPGITGQHGGLIFGLRSGGLLKYHSQTGFKVLKVSLAREGLTPILELSDQSIWARDQNGKPVRVDDKGNLLNSLDHLGGINSDFLCIQFGSGSEDLVFFEVTSDTTLQEIRLHPDGTLSRRFLPFASALSRTTPFVFTSQRKRFNGQGFQIGFSNTIGPVFLNSQGEVFQLNAKQFEDILDMGIRCYLVDNSGQVWFGGNFGVRKVEAEENKFFQYLKNQKWTVGKEAHNSVRGITVKDNWLFANLPYKGLFKVSLTDNTEEPFIDNQVIRDGDFHYWGHALIPYEDDLLCGTYHLYQIDDSSGMERQLDFTKDWHTIREIWSIYPEKADKIWIGRAKGIQFFNPQTNTFSFPTWDLNEPDVSALQNAQVLAILPAEKERVWVCSGAGLYLVDPRKGPVSRYWMGGSEPFYIPATDVQHLHQDRDGTLWLGTAFGGLIHLDISSGSYRQYTEKDGFPNDNIYCVYEDNFENLWMGSDNGIIRLDKRTQAVKFYLPNDGINQAEFNRIAHYQTEDGQLFFGGLNGVTGFNPNDFSAIKDSCQAPLVVTRFRKFLGKDNELVDQTVQFADQQEIVLQPDDRFVSLEFALLDFFKSKQVLYAYFLEGVDKQWHVLDNNTLQLSGLPYGTHLLRVRAQSGKGEWTVDQLSIPIVVHRPFYLRWWFWGIFLLGLVFISVGYTQRRVAILKRRKLLLEREVARQTQQIQEDKQKIEKQAEALKELDRMKSRFFANISHELRTPLTLILGPLRSVMKRQSPDSQDLNQLRFVESSGKKLLNLINEILDLSKLDSGRMTLQEKQVDLWDELETWVTGFKVAAATKLVAVVYETNLKPGQTVLLDSKKLETIFNNLTSNALKFSPSSSTIQLKALKHGHLLHFSVQDEGPGIPPADQPKIFDRFFQSSHTQRPEGGGTGIGLSLSRDLAELMGGKLSVESEVGQGATFFLDIPCKTPKLTSQIETLEGGPEVVQVEPEVVERGRSGHVNLPSRFRVLVVEDNGDLRTYLSQLLSGKYQVTTAEDGQEAWDWLSSTENANQVDLILSDIMMPRMDGFELLERIKAKENLRIKPVVMLTARADIKDKLSALRIGVDAYLLKPFLEEELMVRIENLLTNYRERLLFSQEGPENLPLIEDVKIPQVSQTDQKWLEKLEKVTLEHMNDPDFNLDQLSSLMITSRRTMTRKVKELTGITANGYLRQVRLEEARRRLEIGQVDTIKALCLEVGFRDTAYFSKLFKQQFGKTPTEYE
jgi:signal transduction histidine kinase/DNA-binding response OmpR family regulator